MGTYLPYNFIDYNYDEGKDIIIIIIIIIIMYMM
jgi:hypothetical protein